MLAVSRGKTNFLRSLPQGLPQPPSLECGRPASLSLLPPQPSTSLQEFPHSYIPVSVSTSVTTGSRNLHFGYNERQACKLFYSRQPFSSPCHLSEVLILLPNKHAAYADTQAENDMPVIPSSNHSLSKHLLVTNSEAGTPQDAGNVAKT